MKYLILGSEGQIGRSLVEFVLRGGDEVIRFDIRIDPAQDLRLFEPTSHMKFLEAAVEECDFIFFLAWDVGGSKYLFETEYTFDFVHNNVSIMKNVFSVINKYKKPFVFTSSQMAAMSHSPYGNTKLLGERYTKTLGGISVRLWNVYGYEKVDERSHVITDFINMAENDGLIRMRTTGKEKRQFLYVEDCCEALVVLSKIYNDVSRDEDLHISSYSWITIKKIAHIISSAYGCKYVKGKLEDNVQMAIQEKPNKNMLKYWKPKTSVKEGIKNLIKQFRTDVEL